jgi:hypothetical protein
LQLLRQAWLAQNFGVQALRWDEQDRKFERMRGLMYFPLISFALALNRFSKTNTAGNFLSAFWHSIRNTDFLSSVHFQNNPIFFWLLTAPLRIQ